MGTADSGHCNRLQPKYARQCNMKIAQGGHTCRVWLMRRQLQRSLSSNEAGLRLARFNQTSFIKLGLIEPGPIKLDLIELSPIKLSLAKLRLIKIVTLTYLAGNLLGNVIPAGA